MGCFDVLEHIPEDKALLTRLRQLLSPGRRLLVSVPQHPWLWSNEDNLACHQRRYTSSGLLHLAEKCGLKCIWRTSFVCSLAPLMLLRLFKPNPRSSGAGIASLEFFLPKSVNWILCRLLSAERSAISRGVSLPFGGSLFMVLEKTEKNIPFCKISDV